MQYKVRIHYDNKRDFRDPRLLIWVSDGATLEKEVAPAGRDKFGLYYDVKSNRSRFNFIFKDVREEEVTWEDESLNRYYEACLGEEIWAMSDRHNIYNVQPARPRGNVKDYYEGIKKLIPQNNFYMPDTDVSGFGIPSMLGANILTDGSIIFGFFHPRAARVFLTGNFNDWQCPGHPSPSKERFIEMELDRGFYYKPNIWLARIKPDKALNQIEYKFFVQGGAGENERYVCDPYTRVFSDDFRYRNSVVVDPTRFKWSDQSWKTPQINDLILYELNVYGFTDNDPAVPDEYQGTFLGVSQRIKEGYFNELGITVIALMPTSEVPQKRGLGYEPCTFMAVEKDFGTPDDFREMVNEAHNHGLAVIIDQVFNHTSNDFNPLWMLIDDGSGDGGFYFEGKTMWGNKVATGKDEVDNMLVDSCKMFIKEYHIDGFRFDATHSYFLNHKLLHRLAHEIKDKGFKPDAIMVVENLPNEEDLNMDGYNGYAQWSDIFHDKIKALLREGEFEGIDNSPDDLGDMFYFSKESFAAHTNNVINYCESHDENSVQYEVATGDEEYLRQANIKNRKARLGMMSTLVALGQPMIYMGQEYGIERERNRIDVNWAKYPQTHSFYEWTKRLIKLRRHNGSLKLSGYNPAEEGKFEWILGPWMDKKRGGGKRVIGWRATNADADTDGFGERVLVILNFEGRDLNVDVDFGFPGKWEKLVDIDNAVDITDGRKGGPLDGNMEGLIAGTDNQSEVIVHDFILPPYSGFVYKYAP